MIHEPLTPPQEFAAPESTEAFYAEVIRLMAESEIPFLLSGTYALSCYTGIVRPTKDVDVFAPEPPGPCPLADSNVQVTLNSVSLRGSTAVSADAFKGAYAEYLGRPQPVSVICAIRDRASRTLFDAGILARVEIPEQRIAGGSLVLDVIEAHVVNVRVRGDVGPAQAAVERYVEQQRGMKPFNMTKAQRYLLLASDIPGLRVRAANSWWSDATSNSHRSSRSLASPWCRIACGPWPTSGASSSAISPRVRPGADR